MFKLKDLKDPHVPVLENTPNIYWDEILQNNLTSKSFEDRDFNVIETPEIMYNVIQHAMMMQDYRNKKKKSVEMNSGYRPESYNDVVLIANNYKSTTTSDHKFINSGASDTEEKATNTNMEIWKEVCEDWGVSFSIGMYGSRKNIGETWLHLGWRRDQKTRLWDWRK